MSLLLLAVFFFNLLDFLGVVAFIFKHVSSPEEEVSLQQEPVVLECLYSFFQWCNCLFELLDALIQLLDKRLCLRKVDIASASVLVKHAVHLVYLSLYGVSFLLQLGNDFLLFFVELILVVSPLQSHVDIYGNLVADLQDKEECNKRSGADVAEANLFPELTLVRGDEV